MMPMMNGAGPDAPQPTYAAGRPRCSPGGLPSTSQSICFDDVDVGFQAALKLKPAASGQCYEKRA